MGANIKIEELLQCSADELSKLSDDQLMAHFKPYLHITRPEQARLIRPSSGVTKAMQQAPPEFKNGLAKAAAAGIDLSELLDFSKKKRK